MNKDINDFFWLFRIFIEETCMKFSSKNIQKWWSYVFLLEVHFQQDLLR